MARSKAEKVRAAPETVTLEGVDENGNPEEIKWQVRALKGDEMLAMESIPEDANRERLDHLIFNSLKEDDPNLEKSQCVEMFDFPHLEKILDAVAEVNGLEDFFDEDEVKEVLKNQA